MSDATSLQTVLGAHLARYRAAHTLSPRHWQVCHHILNCRTEVMRGFRLGCDACEATSLHYHACRDRHCPRCQRGASEHWCERQRANVLPVTDYHAVFTCLTNRGNWRRRCQIA
jgi:hypothetical protein